MSEGARPAVPPADGTAVAGPCERPRGEPAVSRVESDRAHARCELRPDDNRPIRLKSTFMLKHYSNSLCAIIEMVRAGSLKVEPTTNCVAAALIAARSDG
jgi:hypothetical protein